MAAQRPAGFRITYNAPVVLTFTFVALTVQVISSTVWPGFADVFFSVRPGMAWGSPLTWFRLVSHVVGHGGWAHLFGNFTMILLLGPILEERHGSRRLLEMLLVTALATGLLNVLLFNTGLMGASGVVFMFIILSSLSNFRDGEIPLTFILVAVLFLGSEVLSAFKADNVSQFAHVAGGLCGAALGFSRDGKGR